MRVVYSDANQCSQVASIARGRATDAVQSPPPPSERARIAPRDVINLMVRRISSGLARAACATSRARRLSSRRRVWQETVAWENLVCRRRCVLRVRLQASLSNEIGGKQSPRFPGRTSALTLSVDIRDVNLESEDPSGSVEGSTRVPWKVMI